MLIPPWVLLSSIALGLFSAEIIIAPSDFNRHDPRHQFLCLSRDLEGQGRQFLGDFFALGLAVMRRQVHARLEELLSTLVQDRDNGQ